MRPRASRLLHVLACAPVVAAVAASIALSSHALAATEPAQLARPFIVALDAGHGGAPDNAHPDRPYDSGAVATNGLLEKDLALDEVRRVARLLRAEGVQVLLTRDSDVYMDITTRMQKAIDAHADLFVSVHFNGYTDPASSGSLVMFPNPSCLPFAQRMADALTRRLSPYAVLPNGLMQRPEMFQHATMPTVTVEPLFLTNPHEAALVAREDVREAIAQAVVDGVGAQAGEQIRTVSALDHAYGAARSALGSPLLLPGRTSPVAIPTVLPGTGTGPVAKPTGVPVVVGGGQQRAPATAAQRPLVITSPASAGPPMLGYLIVLCGAVSCWLMRRHIVTGLALSFGALLRAVATLGDIELPALPHLDTRGRRRAARRRALLERSRLRQSAHRTVLYDELWFRPLPLRGGRLARR